MQLQSTDTKIFTSTIANTEQLLQDYIDHGVFVHWTSHMDEKGQAISWQEENRHRAPAFTWPYDGKLCNHLAKELGWHIVRARVYTSPTHCFASMTVPSVALSRGFGTELLLVCKQLKGGEARPKGREPSFRRGVKVTYFFFDNAQQVQVFEDWYAGLYRDPNVVRALTKRGRTVHTYPER